MNHSVMDQRPDAVGSGAVGVFKRTLAAALLMLMSGTVQAQAAGEAMETYARGDHARAFDQWMTAARSGDPKAQQTVGFLYSLGEGVPRDNVRAHMWLSLAAAYHPSQTDHKRAERARTRIAHSLTQEQRHRSARLAREWMARHTRPGHIDEKAKKHAGRNGQGRVRSAKVAIVAGPIRPISGPKSTPPKRSYR